MKNKGMNMAMIESEMIPKTSLANVPRKFYPTLMLVGPDKKAATFLDENGEPTNSMPRKNTLEEDKETLSALLQSPNTHPTVKNSVNPENYSSHHIQLDSSSGPPGLLYSGRPFKQIVISPGISWAIPPSWNGTFTGVEFR
jgi:hypothetical protein